MSELNKPGFATVLRGLTLCMALALSIGPARAQNLYAPVARVNDAVVTEYEVQQRMRFLQVLGAPGSDRDGAIQALIDDRLREAEANRVGLALNEDALQAGLTEFASRANLSRDEFVAALAQAGVAPETFRDFVAVTLIWRDLIRARYNSSVNISDAEIDRELGTSSSGTGLRVLLSEIIIPAPPQNAARVAALATEISQTRSEAAFSDYARRYSATASRDAGGKMPWTPLDDLPPQLHPIILALSPGEVSAPLNIPNAVALFQLRGIEETQRSAPSYSAIDYAAYYINGGRTEEGLARAAKVRAQVDSCDDLYGVAKGQPANVLDRGSKAPGEIPQDIAFELSKLDPGESSVALTRADGQTLVFLMLCSRTAAANAEVDREQVVSALRQRKLQGYADVLLQKLRANARIVRQ